MATNVSLSIGDAFVFMPDGSLWCQRCNVYVGGGVNDEDWRFHELIAHHQGGSSPRTTTTAAVQPLPVPTVPPPSDGAEKSPHSSPGIRAPSDPHQPPETSPPKSEPPHGEKFEAGETTLRVICNVKVPVDPFSWVAHENGKNHRKKLEECQMELQRKRQLSAAQSEEGVAVAMPSYDDHHRHSSSVEVCGSPPPVEMSMCPTCNGPLTGPLSGIGWRIHEAGKPHQRKLRELEFIHQQQQQGSAGFPTEPMAMMNDGTFTAAPLPASAAAHLGQYRCEVCDVALSGAVGDAQWHAHAAGKQHQRKLLHLAAQQSTTGEGVIQMAPVEAPGPEHAMQSNLQQVGAGNFVSPLWAAQMAPSVAATSIQQVRAEHAALSGGLGMMTMNPQIMAQYQQQYHRQPTGSSAADVNFVPVPCAALPTDGPTVSVATCSMDNVQAPVAHLIQLGRELDADIIALQDVPAASYCEITAALRGTHGYELCCFPQTSAPFCAVAFNAAKFELHESGVKCVSLAALLEARAAKEHLQGLCDVALLHSKETNLVACVLRSAALATTVVVVSFALPSHGIGLDSHTRVKCIAEVHSWAAEIAQSVGTSSIFVAGLLNANPNSLSYVNATALTNRRAELCLPVLQCVRTHSASHAVVAELCVNAPQFNRCTALAAVWLPAELSSNGQWEVRAIPSECAMICGDSSSCPGSGDFDDENGLQRHVLVVPYSLQNSSSSERTFLFCWTPNDLPPFNGERAEAACVALLSRICLELYSFGIRCASSDFSATLAMRSCYDNYRSCSVENQIAHVNVQLYCAPPEEVMIDDRPLAAAFQMNPVAIQSSIQQSSSDAFRLMDEAVMRSTNGTMTEKSEGSCSDGLLLLDRVFSREQPELCPLGDGSDDDRNSQPCREPWFTVVQHCASPSGSTRIVAETHDFIFYNEMQWEVVQLAKLPAITETREGEHVPLCARLRIRRGV